MQSEGRLCKKDLSIVMRPATAELVDLEFPLYQKYQVHQHNDPPYKVCLAHNFSNFSALLAVQAFLRDPCLTLIPMQVTKKQFQRFLVDSPLVPVPPSSGRPLCLD